MPTSRRGVIQVGPATTVQGDPSGLMRRTLTWTERTELFVHPRTVALERLGAGLLRDLEGATTEDISMSDLAFHALREYQPGDDRRYIHWRSSAKAGKLLVRQFLDTRRSHVTVIVDPDPEQYRSGQGRTGQTDRDVERDVMAANAPTAIETDVETAISVGSSIMVARSLDEQDWTVICATSGSEVGPQVGLDAMSRIEPGPVDLYGLARWRRARARHEHRLPRHGTAPGLHRPATHGRAVPSRGEPGRRRGGPACGPRGASRRRARHPHALAARGPPYAPRLRGGPMSGHMSSSIAGGLAGPPPSALRQAPGAGQRAADCWHACARSWPPSSTPPSPWCWWASRSSASGRPSTGWAGSGSAWRDCSSACS